MPGFRPMSSFDLTDPTSYATPPLECDLVMKGGITSGLVYPKAAARLATRYRFRSVGGASAGAIAAGLTAAAEYRRQQAATAGADRPGTEGAGFTQLVTIPQVLGAKLSTLFVPSARLRRVYEALTAWVEPGWGKARKLWATITAVVLGAPVIVVGITLLLLVPGLLVALGVQGWSVDAVGWSRALWSLLVWLPAALLIGLVVGAVVLIRRTLAELPRNGYGFCRGMADRGATTADPPLTVWLTNWLDQVAGLGPEDGPLTFGHLYGEKASAVFRELGLDEAGAAASPLVRGQFTPELDLQMMTTCLTFTRPYVFPFRTKVFCYCPQCWQDYFPSRVLKQLNDTSVEPPPVTQNVEGQQVPIDLHCVHHRDTPVRMLPSVPDIPVVIGVRMSLSFPILLSAVPFQAVDFNRAAGKRGLIEVWFSDGGLASNFPIHFFDALLPTRPTFGINLTDPHPDRPEQRVYRPRGNASGLTPRAHAFTSVGGFLGALYATMHDWVDGMALPAPGFRDRIVDVRTGEGEGGLNLKMTSETIEALGARGDQAAVELEDFDFDNHRWVRYRTAMGGLSETLDGMLGARPEYAPFIDEGYDASYAFGSQSARQADVTATTTLLDTAQAWADAGYPATDGPLPRPRPQVRTVMRQ